MCQDIYGRLVETCDVETRACVKGGARYSPVVRRQACRKCLNMWREATVAGKRQEFEHEWNCHIQCQAKRRKSDTHGEIAIAASPSAGDESQSAVAEELMTAGVLHDLGAGAADPQTAVAASSAS